MRTLLRWLGRWLARFLSKQTHVHGTGPATHPDRLLACLQPGDVLLVEGNSRVSTAIKYLTQSTWSHAALYVGAHLGESGGDPRHCFIEADIIDGVRSVGIDEFRGLHTRICRPIGLDDWERRKLAAYAVARLGNQYDLRNVIDLARYLLPTPPVPTRFRRRLLALGSGDPTRAICSTLIAQAFQSIRYPILPVIDRRRAESPDCPGCVEEILRVRHHSLFAPRDFDVSPYFQVVKPTLEANFDFHALRWEVIPAGAPALMGDDVTVRRYGTSNQGSAPGEERARTHGRDHFRQPGFHSERWGHSAAAWLAPVFVVVSALLAPSGAVAAGITLPWQRPATLDAVEGDVAKRYDDVEQITIDQLEARRRATGTLILLDVRQPDEYAVSHLAGAIRVDPDARADEVLAATGPLPPGARVVVYCSVGERSSHLAERTQDALKAHGAADVANLRGGIFAWYNERRPLVNAQGPTDDVHGFDAKWGRLLQRRGSTIVVPE